MDLKVRAVPGDEAMLGGRVKIQNGGDFREEFPERVPKRH